MHSHQLPTLALGGDVFLGCLGGDGKGGGGLEEGLGVELGWEVGPELLLAEGAGIGGSLDRCGDVGKVLYTPMMCSRRMRAIYNKPKGELSSVRVIMVL